MNEKKAAFEEAFPEVAGMHDKMSELRRKVVAGEMSYEEAESILKETKRVQKEVREKIKALNVLDT
jgi:hypothetical protein